MTTQEKILNKAAQLFHEKGFSASTVREIAGEVGMEAASLYNHISSKAQILEQICFETAELFKKEMETVTQSELSPLEKLDRLIDFHLSVAIQDPKVLMVFSQEWRHLPEKSRKRFQILRKEYEEAFQNILIEGQNSSMINADLKPSILVKMVLSSMQWVYFLKKKSAKTFEAEIRKNIKHLVKNGVTN